MTDQCDQIARLAIEYIQQVNTSCGPGKEAGRAQMRRIDIAFQSLEKAVKDAGQLDAAESKESPSVSTETPLDRAPEGFVAPSLDKSVPFDPFDVINISADPFDGIEFPENVCFCHGKPHKENHEG